jgi:hypothetical protein
LEHKSEENGKDLISLLGTVDDGVKKEFLDGVKSKMDDGAEET